MTNKKEEIIIYSSPRCHFCDDVKEFFKEHKVSYIEYDVSKDLEKRAEMVNTTGQMGVPVIVKGDIIMIGFKKDELLKMIK